VVFKIDGSGPPEEGPICFEVILKVMGLALPKRGPVLPTVRGALFPVWGDSLRGPALPTVRGALFSGMGWLPKRPGFALRQRGVACRYGVAPLEARPATVRGRCDYLFFDFLFFLCASEGRGSLRAPPLG